MQKIPAVTGKGGAFAILAVVERNSTRSIERVAHQRESGMAEMDPDLVGPSRGNGHFQERRVFMGESTDHPNMAYRWPTVGTIRVYGFQPPIRNGPNGRIDRKGVRHGGSGGQRQIHLADSFFVHGLS